MGKITYTDLGQINEDNNSTVSFCGYDMDYTCSRNKKDRRLRLSGNHYPHPLAEEFIVEAATEIRSLLGVPNTAYCSCSALTDDDEGIHCKEDIKVDASINPWSMSLPPADHYPNAKFSYTFEYDTCTMSVYFPKNGKKFPSIDILSKG